MITQRLFSPRVARLVAWLRGQSGFEWAAVILAVLVGLALLLGRLPAPPASRTLTLLPERLPATPALATLPAGPTAPPATEAPTTLVVGAALPAGPTLTRAVVAFDAPDGQVLGAIEGGRRYQVRARSGLSWAQLDVEGSGAVWVRLAELDALAGAPDLATPVPAPPPQVRSIVSPPAPAVPAADAAPPADDSETPPPLPPGSPPGSSWSKTTDGRWFVIWGGVPNPQICRPYGDWRDHVQPGLGYKQPGCP
jgi:hypothetical protein